MTTGRLEVRLDAERQRKLSELAHQRGTTVAAVVREMIDLLYEEAGREERLAAARRIIAAELEDVPAPAELNRELDDRRGRYAALR
jgi:hypothetical protein